MEVILIYLPLLDEHFGTVSGNPNDPETVPNQDFFFLGRPPPLLFRPPLRPALERLSAIPFLRAIWIASYLLFFLLLFFICLARHSGEPNFKVEPEDFFAPLDADEDFLPPLDADFLLGALRCAIWIASLSL